MLIEFMCYPQDPLATDLLPHIHDSFCARCWSALATLDSKCVTFVENYVFQIVGISLNMMEACVINIIT